MLCQYSASFTAGLVQKMTQFYTETQRIAWVEGIQGGGSRGFRGEGRWDSGEKVEGIRGGGRVEGIQGREGQRVSTGKG